MPRVAISTDRAPAAIGPYSQAVRAGSEVFLSGQIPLDPATGELVQLLPQWGGRETGVYAVCPARPPSPGARALTEFLASRWNEVSDLT